VIIYYLALHDLTSAGALNSSASASDATKTAATIALESKVLRLTEKLKMSDEKCSEFVIENKQIDTLKDTLRDKNNNIKELKRSIEDLGKNKNQGNTISGDKTNDELRLKIVDLMEENKTLKQALAVATIGLKPSSSTDRIAK
jgi:predicted RNase H-like nuclease (RuvC/YqgF family)